MNNIWKILKSTRLIPKQSGEDNRFADTGLIDDVMNFESCFVVKSRKIRFYRIPLLFDRNNSNIPKFTRCWIIYDVSYRELILE